MDRWVGTGWETAKVATDASDQGCLGGTTESAGHGGYVYPVRKTPCGPGEPRFGGMCRVHEKTGRLGAPQGV